MILFPIALIWLIASFAWIIKNSLNDPEHEAGDEPRQPRRFRPRGPRRGPSKTGGRAKASAASRRSD